MTDDAFGAYIVPHVTFAPIDYRENEKYQERSIFFRNSSEIEHANISVFASNVLICFNIFKYIATFNIAIISNYSRAYTKNAIIFY